MEWSNESKVGVKMSEPPMREIECFLVLAEELHFGRTGERLFISQSRVSQLISALERRIGTSLVARTSRRVHLTEFGADFSCVVGSRASCACRSNRGRSIERHATRRRRFGWVSKEQFTIRSRLLSLVSRYNIRKHA